MVEVEKLTSLGSIAKRHYGYSVVIETKRARSLNVW